MPYIGSDPSNRFVAPKAASVFSGDGSTTAFTLDHAVGSDEDILVSVDGVIQEPSVAYAVSSGTTLTFTAAPSSNSGNNIFVYYLFRTVGTVSHPSNNALTATNGTLTGNGTISGTLDVTGNVGLGGANTSSYLQGVVGGKTATIGDGSQASSALVLKDDDGVFDIATTGGTLRIYDDNNERLRMDSTGAVTIPSQPAFLAVPASSQTNIPINGATTIAFGTEIFDQNGDFASNTFTAPVTGKYQLQYTATYNSPDPATDYVEHLLITSNRNYQIVLDPDGFDSSPLYHTFNICVLADMDASDTAYIRVQMNNSGSSQMDISTSSYFSGYLVC